MDQYTRYKVKFTLCFGKSTSTTKQRKRICIDVVCEGLQAAALSYTTYH